MSQRREPKIVWSPRFAGSHRVRGLPKPQSMAIRGVVLALCFVFSSISGGFLSAQIVDSFEGGAPRWNLVDFDSDAKIRRQEISPQIPHSGLTCEAADLQMGSGTLAILGYGTKESLVLDEVVPSVWVRSTQRGISIGVRVVFRSVLHPVTGKPRSLWVWGDSYEALGSWQRLQVTGIPQKLGQSVRALRSEFGSELEWNDVVIDCIGLNVYSNSGKMVVQIDDLEVTGLVDAPENRKRSSPGSLVVADLDPLKSAMSRDNSTLPTIGNTSTTSNLLTNRWVQYQGESLEWLSSLGVKGLILSGPPTLKELEQADNLGLRVISPPPAVPPDANEAPAWNALEGWMLGNYVDQQNLDELRRRAEVLRGSMSVLQKPLVLEPVEGFWAYSRYANTLIIPCLSTGSYEQSTELTEFLEFAMRECRGNPQVYASVGTQPSVEWQRQVQAVAKLLDQPQENVTHGDPYQIRSQMYRALAAGAQGIYFRSRSPLDADNAVDRTRANMLQWLNAELDLLTPWLSAARGNRARVQLTDGGRDATIWDASKSQLIVVQPAGPTSHISSASLNQGPLKISWQQSSPSAQVMRITEWKLESLPQRRTGGLVEVQIDRPHSIEFLISTNDPMVLSYFNQRFQILGSSFGFAVANIAQMRLAAAQEIVSSRWQAATNERLTQDLLALQRAARELEQSYTLIGTNLPAAVDLMLRSLEAAQLVIHNSWSVARADVPSVQSAPWLLASSSVPLHWQLGRRISGNAWRDLGLAGGSMESLDVILAAGWKQDRRLQERADVLTEVVPVDNNNQEHALRLAARGKDRPLEGGYAGSSLRIQTSSLPVQAGQVVRIEGKVLIRNGFDKPQSGLLVYESIEGPSLGQLMKGPKETWLPIRIYRVVEQSGTLEVMLELRGEGDLLVDNLTVATAIPSVDVAIPPQP